MTANNPKFGTILVDGQGRTLYALTNNGAAVLCTGGCLAIWPAALLPAGQTTVTPGPGANGVTTASAAGLPQLPGGADTQRLLVYNGLPFHLFSGDVSPGAANGDSINSFGWVRHVVKLSDGSSRTRAPSGSSTASYSGAESTTTTTPSGRY